ncbi:MAG: hypothetical protein NW204_14925 [Xanthomonadaceae bacterium]|nr:hypothetical protein [Xanthomonadaceae bacterium]
MSPVRKTSRLGFAALALCMVGGAALAQSAGAGDDAIVAALQTQWAQIKYAIPKAQQAAAFEQLAVQARAAAREKSDAAPVQIWAGIVLASDAGAKGGLGALSLVKEARRDLERALELDPGALDGSAYTSLGSLYYQVPGWPLGFGDDKKARAMLEQGLAINPDGIDSNFFYGDFLREQGDYAGAEKALKKALEAPPRPGRESADAGRRDEIRQALAQVRGKLTQR